MAQIRAFRGIRYNLETPETLGRYVSPPYDMLDADTITDLYNRDPANAVRIIQNRADTGDRENRDRHNRAAALLKQWLADGTLLQEESAGLYLYRQRFAIPQAGEMRQFERTGVVVCLKLVDFDTGIVQPHEYTLSGPKADRYELMECTRANTGQIFGIASDDGSLHEAIRAATESSNLLGTFTDSNDVRHELSRIATPESIARIESLMRERTVLIADGHHRYETALQYARNNSAPGAQYIMMTLVSMSDPGLVIRPFHRVMKKHAMTQPFTRESLARYFDLTPRGDASQETVNLFLGDEPADEMLYLDRATQKLYGLSVNGEGRRFLEENAQGMSPLWNSLAVSRINRLCVQGIMKQPLDGTVLHDVMDYVNDPNDAFVRGTQGEDYLGVIFIRPVAIETIQDIVSRGERMPQKSTNFYPKLYSGLVFNSLDS